jgi:hypothetical protein
VHGKEEHPYLSFFYHAKAACAGFTVRVSEDRASRWGSKVSYEKVGRHELCDVICSFQSSLLELYARAISAMGRVSYENGYKNAGEKATSNWASSK